MSDDDRVSYTPYRPGDMGRILALQAAYYAAAYDLDHVYEGVVAAQMGEFLKRYDSASDLVLVARLGGEVAGSITIDCHEPGSELARLRWFIVSDALRGKGAGRHLIGAAMDFLRGSGKPGCYLTTFEGLAAVRHLYLDAGFELVHEAIEETWGKPVNEQRYEWRP
ncbi:MAG: GNAT family N-acetyltransferase [Magnetovibrio sp.]|nr:GNAT family N-acetyltransferase [Magnetovibrio sp.]